MSDAAAEGRYIRDYEMNVIPKYTRIRALSEGQYLDGGGCLTHEQQDHWFTEAMKALRSAEVELYSLRYLKRKCG